MLTGPPYTRYHPARAWAPGTLPSTQQAQLPSSESYHNTNPPVATIHPTGVAAFGVNELNSSLTVYSRSQQAHIHIYTYIHHMYTYMHVYLCVCLLCMRSCVGLVYIHMHGYICTLAQGLLTAQHRYATVPSSFTNFNKAAEVVVFMTTTGRSFVFVSNRGHNSIVSFEFIPSGGVTAELPPRLALQRIQFIACGGSYPRNFILLAGQAPRLLIANENSGNIVLVDVEPANGALSPSMPPGQNVSAVAPTVLLAAVVPQNLLSHGTPR